MITATKTTTTKTTEVVEHTRAQPSRRRVTIPHTDLWTQEWWDAQTDPSSAVRRLVHEDIQANGVGDLTGRLVTTPRLVVPAAPAASVAPVVPVVDPRDAELAELRGQVAELHTMLAPLMPFFTVLVEGKVA